MTGESYAVSGLPVGVYWLDVTVFSTDGTRAGSESFGFSVEISFPQTFTEVAQLAGIVESDWTFSVAWADYDKDGYLDFCIANANGQQDRVYHNKTVVYVIPK